MSDSPVIAEIVRSGFVEGRHRGAVVMLDGDGSVAFALGDVERPIFPRSASKPMQVGAMVGAGLELDAELLALAAASHSAEEFHLEGVRRILASAGLDEAALQTPPSLPLGVEALHRYLRAGGQPSRIVMNCSGKHAAMLATCALNEWPLSTYLELGHPLQKLISETTGQFAGERVAAVGTDGCGAPVLAISLVGLARAYRAHVLADADTPPRRVADAIRAHPRFVGGTDHDDSRLMRGIPGLLAKEGAEGVFALALGDGRAAALKVDDGAHRACRAAAIAVLRRFDRDAPILGELAHTPVPGEERFVPEVRAVGFDGLLARNVQ